MNTSINTSQSSLKSAPRALLYARSANEQTPGRASAVNHQLKALRKFVKDQGYTNQGEYVDEGASGLNSLRPGVRDLVDACRKGHADIVVVTDLARIARSIGLLLSFVGELDRLGVRIETSSAGPLVSFQSIFDQLPELVQKG